ncbi:outer membrane protein assembly factor BamB [Limnohabitans sp.]|uniref:outer membrane protein assembly factor BamB n=1 Tax=Limnohabitans sp. TaxID=1907725 RepID=UPI00286F2F08|nr:outer membrane protein assembly factor BamB [Limnohabitans sp.]
MNTTTSRWLSLTRLALVGVCLALAACSGPSRPKPTEIQGVQVLQDMRTSWTANVGKVDFPLVVSAREDRIALANSQGVVAVLDATTGKDIWRLKLDQAISAGVGSDGQQLAVVTRTNELVALRDGKVQWRKSMPAQSFTAPLVAGARVFVLTADRSVIAFDGATGRQLWTQQRPGEPLVLKQAGVLLAFKNTLLVGLSGRLVGLDPNTGVIRWESAIATPRGTNDIERLVDLVAPFDRVGDVVCVRAFQAAVGCVNAERGQGLWTRPSAGEMGVSGNDNLLIAAMSNGVVQAFNRSNGERLWDTERLKYRILSAPLVTPRGVLVADNGGWLYLLSLADGALLNRIKLDSEELASAPVLAGGRYVVVTREGRVTGLQIP